MQHPALICHATRIALLVTAGWTFGPAEARERETESEQRFAQRVWPILQSKCLPCHGEGKELQGALDLRTPAGARLGGDSGKSAIVAHLPASSPMLRAVLRTDEEYSAMPPKENDRLTADEVEQIRRWLVSGASWPDERRRAEIAAAPDAWNQGQGVLVSTSGGLSPEWTQRAYKPENLWPYRPLRKPAVPAVESGRNPVDSFINQRLAALELRPAVRVDRRTLIRRVTYDLTGLPPTPEEIERFLGDPSPDQPAFSRVVERLLASPHYGEHWGRHWLDVVRYADSAGFANDYDRGNAWRYRDYVVRSLNADKPYNQFVREQIAGDEINADDPEMLVAVGFLRMGPWELTGMEVAKIARQRFLDDVTDAVGQVFLAHPLQCARCHDHKFDPIPTRDYYALQASFATTQLAEREAAFLPHENTAGFGEQHYLLQRKVHFDTILAELNQKEEQAARRWCAERRLDYVPRNQGLRQGIPEEKLPPRHVGFAVEDYGLERIARKGLERLKWELDRYEPIALSVYVGRTPVAKSVSAPQRMLANRLTQGEFEQTAILAGGDPFSPTVPVAPGTLSVVAGLAGVQTEPVDFKFPKLQSIAGRRKALAEWIVDPRNPLTARVMANRVWQWHFGPGLAGNPNNFGATGKKPSHPELLDWLAATLMESGWSLKSLHRLILNSEAYCRSSEFTDQRILAARDPQHGSYAVFQPRRLSADEIRDTQLLVSGELNLAVGGIPVRPEMNLEAALQPRQVMGTFAAAWQPSPSPGQRHRRSLYALRLRGLRDPFLEVFNEPSPETSCEAREASLVSPQVFSLFNSAASNDRALAFADRLWRGNNDRQATIDHAIRMAFGRRPTAAEVVACLAHWEQMTERHRSLSFVKPDYPREVMREAVEENTGERFQFREELEFLPDFVPDLKPSDVDAATRGLADVCLVLMNSNEFVYVY